MNLRRDEDIFTGDYSETDLLQGSFRFHCISRVGLEAERLALICSRNLRHFRILLRQAGFFQIGRHIQISEQSDAATLVEDAAEKTYQQVVVSFPVYYQENVRITPSGTIPADTLEPGLIKIRGLGVRVGDNNQLLPYYPAQVDSGGLPSGPNVVVQDSVWADEN
jgi:hypothetical protein